MKEVIFFAPKCCSRTLLLALQGARLYLEQKLSQTSKQPDEEVTWLLSPLTASHSVHESDNLLVLDCTYLKYHPLMANVVHFAVQFEQIRISWYQRNQPALIKVNCPTFVKLGGFRSRT